MVGIDPYSFFESQEFLRGLKMFLLDIYITQEKKDQARYFEAQVTEIQKRLHDIRGCRCLFTIRYVHDSTEVVDIMILPII